MLKKRGAPTKINEEMLDFLEETFDKDPGLTFKKAYSNMKKSLKLSKDDIQYSQLRKVFCKKRKYSRKRTYFVK